MRFIKLSFLTLFVTTLVSCGAYQYTTATKESNEATTEQQQAVKTQVMKLLEEEYQQPFKLKDFSYKYERHWVDSTCQMSFCEMEKYGTYNFKVKAIDNPIITMNFKFDDEKKESIKDVIDSFKKNQLNKRYCGAFFTYYGMTLKNNKELQQPYTTKTENFCDDRGQSSYKTFKDYYKK